MLIVFDLDDTLLDTTQVLGRKLLEFAFLKVRPYLLDQASNLWNVLWQLYQTHLSADCAWKEFLELYAEGICYKEAERYFNQFWREKEIEISLMQGAHKTLETLFGHAFYLALVTSGKEERQYDKLRNCGVDLSLFDSITVVDGANKGAVYRKLLKEKKLNACDVVVCGDRIARDLSPAKALGMHSVHIRWGRGLGRTGPKKDVDYTILHLEEVVPIVEHLAKDRGDDRK